MVPLTGGPQADVGAAESVVPVVLLHAQLREGGIEMSLAPYMSLQTEIPATGGPGQV